MRRPLYNYFAFIAPALAVMILFASCASTPQSRFYLLQPFSTPAKQTVNAERSSRVAIGVGPVTIPEYLDRPTLVTRTDTYELQLAEYERWAESLDKSIMRVVRQRLSEKLEAAHVVDYPWVSLQSVDYQVVLHVDQFEGCLFTDSVMLRLTWLLLENERSTPTVLKSVVIEEPVTAKGCIGFVSAMSRALIRLADSIAASIASGEKLAVP